MRVIYDRLKIVSSETIIKLMEEDIRQPEAQIKDLDEDAVSEAEEIEAKTPDI